MNTYTTKLKCGQTAWFMKDNKVVSLPVGKVDVSEVSYEKNTCYTTITYGFRIYDDRGCFKEWEKRDEPYCFASKEELLASL